MYTFRFRATSHAPSSLGVSRTGSASDWCALQEALYKCIDTIQYIAFIGVQKNMTKCGEHWVNEKLQQFQEIQ